jgi:acyl-CoA reductase-like NAD-dependent aldehyde dehydrogenase
VLAVTPFNFPLNLACHKLAPALAAGCPVIWKPSPQAPGVAEQALALLAQAGCPEGLVQLAHLTDEQVARLVADDRLALLSFTGSDAVGRHLQKLTGRARALLELGGNAAVILHQLDDVAAAARAVAIAAVANAGQSCVGVQRIFIPAEREDWAEALTSAFAAVPAGDPWDENVLCGPVISSRARARITALLERYRAQGGRLRCGGTWDGLVLAPTLVDGLAPSAPGVYDTEAFAPLATLHRYRELGEAIHGAELGPYGLQAGIFTRDEDAIRAAFTRLEVGTLVVNDVPSRRDDRLPFGGMKASGAGREGTLGSVLDYAQAKVLWRPG